MAPRLRWTSAALVVRATGPSPPPLPFPLRRRQRLGVDLLRVVRLALALKGNGLDATDVTAVLTFLVHDCLMPFASRDTSSGYSKVLGVKSSLRPFLEQTKATFSGNGTPPPTAHQPKRP